MLTMGKKGMLWFGMGAYVKPADLSLEKDAAQDELPNNHLVETVWICMMRKSTTMKSFKKDVKSTMVKC